MLIRYVFRCVPKISTWCMQNTDFSDQMWIQWWFGLNFDTETGAGTVRLTNDNVRVTGRESIIVTISKMRWTVQQIGNQYLQLVPAHSNQHRASDMVGQEAIDFVTGLEQLEFATQVCGGQQRIRLRDVGDEPLPFELFPFNDGRASMYVREVNRDHPWIVTRLQDQRDLSSHLPSRIV